MRGPVTFPVHAIRSCSILNRMKWLVAAVVGFVPVLATAQTPTVQGPDRLRPQVEQMLQADKDNPPSTEGVLFAGDDVVAGWDLRHYFGRYRTTRRGLAGATVADATYFADKLIIPFKPSTILLEIGDTQQAVPATVGAFIAKIHGALPKTMIVVMSGLGAPRETNEQLKALAAADKGLRYVNLDDLAGPDGKPDPALLLDGKLADGKHALNKLGYDLLSQVVLKEIQKAEARYWRGYDPVDGQ